MTAIRFYHLQTQTMTQALPALITKAYEQGHKILVKTADERTAQDLSEHLWTSNPGSFLPHGTAKDGYKDLQPIFLTPGNDNPAGADVLIVAGGETPQEIESFALCCEMLDGRNEAAIKAARERWKTYKEAGHEVTYWQQTPQGGWEQKV